MLSPDKLPPRIRFRITSEDLALAVVRIDRILLAEEEKKKQEIICKSECIIN